MYHQKPLNCVFFTFVPFFSISLASSSVCFIPVRCCLRLSRSQLDRGPLHASQKTTSSVSLKPRSRREDRCDFFFVDAARFPDADISKNQICSVDDWWEGRAGDNSTILPCQKKRGGVCVSFYNLYAFFVCTYLRVPRTVQFCKVTHYWTDGFQKCKCRCFWTMHLSRPKTLPQIIKCTPSPLYQ